MKRGFIERYLAALTLLTLILVSFFSFTASGAFNQDKITGNVIASSCTLYSASWSSENALQGQTVKLYVNGTNCYGKTVFF